MTGRVAYLAAGLFLFAGAAWADGPMVCRSNVAQYQRHNIIQALRCDSKRGLYNACREFDFDPGSSDWKLEDTRYVTQEQLVNKWPDNGGETTIGVTMIVDREQWTFMREAKIRWPEGNTARTVWKGRCSPRDQKGDVTVKERGAVEGETRE